MIKKEGVGAASIIGIGAALNGLISDGGFITSELLEQLSGMNFSTIAIMGAILMLYRKKKEPEPEPPKKCPSCGGSI